MEALLATPPPNWQHVIRALEGFTSSTTTISEIFIREIGSCFATNSLAWDCWSARWPFLGANIARADELQDIKSSGVLVVGVKADYPPFGYLSPTGENIGIEPDLARNLAQRLGVKVQFVPVVAANRIQFLQQGKINLLIATMNDTPEREKIVDIIHPNYYASGYNVMVPKSVKLTELGPAEGHAGLRHSRFLLQQGRRRNNTALN